MKPKICFNLRDGMADVYAFATLYEYLTENGFDVDVSVVYANDKQLRKFRELIGNKGDLEFLTRQSYLLDHLSKDFDVNLKGYSDLSYGLEHNDLLIDLSILKNCAKPISEDKRKELKQKLQIPEDKPVVVVGFPNGSNHDRIRRTKKVIDDFGKETTNYLVGDIELHGEQDRSYLGNDFIYSLREQSRIISARGVLRDYYAIADVALINCNLTHARETMHNFIEATAGGPLFLVKPEYSTQYGYRQLVQRRVIREAENTDDLIAKVKKYLEKPNGEELRKMRTEHLEHSRNLYLKDLHRLINKLLRIKDESFESHLEFSPPSSESMKLSFEALKITHPETDWRHLYTQNGSILIKLLNNKSLDDKCFRRGVE